MKDFFERDPETREIFNVLKKIILRRHPETDIRTGKSQISFGGPKPYCWAWLPIRKGIKGRPDELDDQLLDWIEQARIWRNG